MRLNKYKSGSVESICRGCPMFSTKPQPMPEGLEMHITEAILLSEIQRGGGTFAYPNALTAAEWAMIAALQRGRDVATAKSYEADRKEMQRKRTGR